MQQMSFRYRRRQRLFEQVDLEIPRGSIVGLLGRNGEGKTTLMKIMCGLLHHKAGSVLTLGEEAKKRRVNMLQQVFMLAEDVQLPRMTVQRYFDLISPFYPNYDETLADELVRAFNIDWGMSGAKMSLGQRKKATIALALAVRTPLLLLDEPTNGLDIPSKSVFRRMLARHLGGDQTVIISTHQVRDLEQLIDHLLLLDANKVACNASIAELSELFTIGAVSPELPEPIYSEPSLMGTVGLWRAEAVEGSEEAFSMEIFFNAMMAEGDTMRRIISQGTSTAEPTDTHP